MSVTEGDVNWILQRPWQTLIRVAQLKTEVHQKSLAGVKYLLCSRAAFAGFLERAISAVPLQLT